MQYWPRLKQWLGTIIKVALIAELAWLVIINAALQLPVTQTLINKIRPEKFQVSWQNAWSLYPARVHVTGGFANGQSRSQQWQFEAASVSGSIALLPLIFKRVWVHDVEASDIDYRQRPRLKPGKDYAAMAPFFPEIAGWEMTEAVTARKKKRSWHISVEDIQVSGKHSYWIFNLKGDGEAKIHASLTYNTRDRVLSLDANELDLNLGPLFVNGEQEVFKRGSVRGSMGFKPFVPREHKDISMLGFLLLDADVDVDVNSLAFIDLFTMGIGGASVNGKGVVKGRLRLDQGTVLEGTDLEVDASDLQVRILAHQIRGAGTVALKLGPETGQLMDLGFQYRDLEVSHDDDSRPLLTGQNLELRIGGDGKLLPDPERINESRTISLEIDDLAVPDLALFQRYLPPKWPMSLYGGDGRLDGMASLSPFSLQVDMSLDSDSADLGFQNYRFETNLDAALKLDNPSVMTGGSRIGGTYIKLSESRLKNDEEKDTKPWGASLVIREGEFSLFEKGERQDKDSVIDLFQLLGKSEARQVLGNSSGVMGFTAEVSSLAWIGVLLGGDYRTGVSGSSTISGDILLKSGLPEVGTNIAIESDGLAVNFLEYTSSGDGNITFRVEEGGANPDWYMGIELLDADMKRQGESKAQIQNVVMTLNAVIEDMSFDKKQKQFSLKLDILSAQVTDMSRFNGLLPPDTPLRFVSGTADLSADILLRQDDADGWLRLNSTGLRAQADTQSVRADLLAEMRLVDGVPPDMIFDISGSEINLTNVRVEGDASQFDNEAWSARFTLTRGETNLSAPPRMNLEADLLMSDSRPIVAMFKNQEGWRPEFLAKMMTVEDIEGSARMDMANERVIIPFAHAISDNIEVGAKAMVTEQSRDGVIYFRYKKADALLRISGGKKNLDIIRVRKKFDEYQVGQ
jgi:hypothetical protein